MRTLFALLFVTTFVTGTSAQGLGYAEGGFAGFSGFFGDSSGSFHAGGGGEAIVADRVGIGGEFGFFDRLIVGSANATLHLASLSRRSASGGGRWSPFVTGGYSRMGIGDGEGAFSAVNAGAGLHYWAADRVGLRIEFRDHFRPDDRGMTQYWSVRAGIAFR